MSRSSRTRPVVATIGYEHASVPDFLAALTRAGVEVLVDVRAVASSRRKGFAKTALAANLETAGIEYLHLRGLGTPAEGRVAARAGRHADMERVYAAHLKTLEARDDLMVLADLVATGRKACLLCLEANPEYCHRSMVLRALERQLPVRAEHLRVVPS